MAMGTVRMEEKNRRLSPEEVKEYASMQEELHRLRKQYHLPEEEEKETLFARAGEAWYSFREKHTTLNPVNRKKYCWLCLLGFLGVHHFYAGHWIKGLIYVGLCWTGISAGFSLIDWMIALPKEADAEGMILI